MSQVFEAMIDDLSRKSGYSYDFLCDMYAELGENEPVDDESFAAITLEHDW